MDAATAVALVSAGLAVIIAVTVPWMTFRLALRQDAIRWLREQRAQLYVDLLTEAQAEREWLKYALADDRTRELMAPYFKDLRLPPLERARLAARAAVSGSPTVNRLFGQLMAEGGQALLNLERLERDALQLRARVRIGEIVDELEVAVRRELGADLIPLDTAVPAGAPEQGGGGETG